MVLTDKTKDMKSIKEFIDRIFYKPKWKSKIVTFYGSALAISRFYEKLIDNQNIRITSVSVTRASHAVHREHGNDCTYLMAVSYDYLESPQTTK